MLTSNTSTTTTTNGERSWLANALRIEWLGQTIASVSWILSVFAYGISSNGDWLQLVAGFSWLAANIATLATNKE